MISPRHLLAALLFLTSACGDDESSTGSSAGGAGGGSPVGSGTDGSGTEASTGTDGSGGGGASSTATSANGTGATGTSTTGAGGGLPACVTDVVLLAEAFQSVDCSYPIPPEFEASDHALVLEINGAPQTLCALSSSQGCDPSGGWWTNGGDFLLCDVTCTAVVETEGAKLYLWVGCPDETCD